ncbi:hypothetical protein HKX48_003218 [Thoreauomyces humboldtii]|nr:hypothetical protein HKX48_003218 [Thoreauomyces humboldtii]
MVRRKPPPKQHSTTIPAIASEDDTSVTMTEASEYPELSPMRYMQDTQTLQVAAQEAEEKRLKEMKENALKAVYKEFLLLKAATPILTVNVYLCDRTSPPPALEWMMDTIRAELMDLGWEAVTCVAYNHPQYYHQQILLTVSAKIPTPVYKASQEKKDRQKKLLMAQQVEQEEDEQEEDE